MISQIVKISSSLPDKKWATVIFKPAVPFRIFTDRLPFPSRIPNPATGHDKTSVGRQDHCVEFALRAICRSADAVSGSVHLSQRHRRNVSYSEGS
jgi:hypothetical protein